jgi:deoxyribonuclease V
VKVRMMVQGDTATEEGVVAADGFSAMADTTLLEREQHRLASLAPPFWHPPPGPIVAGGIFVAFARGEQGPGHAGDHAHVGAAATRNTTELARVVVEGSADAPYLPGLLAAREGGLLELAIRALLAEGVVPDVLLIDATGRDHPRSAGLALHVGVVVDIPTVGVTHRPLLASGPEPDDHVGASTELVCEGAVVGRWLRTQQGVRPLAVHAAWRTDDRTAAEVVSRVTASVRTPEPLRLARMAAREARSAAGLGPEAQPE